MTLCTGAVVSLTVALSLGACNKKDDAGSTATAGSAAAAGGRDPCKLLNDAEIAAAVGTPVTKTTLYGDSECRWTLKPHPGFPGTNDAWVDVAFHSEAQMRDVEAAPGTKGVVAITGLGERAHRTNSFRHLWVKHGNDVFVVRSRLAKMGDKSDASMTASDAIETSLARLVLTKL